MPAYNLNFSGTPCRSMLLIGLVMDLTLTRCTCTLFQKPTPCKDSDCNLLCNPNLVYLHPQSFLKNMKVYERKIV